MSMQQTRGYKRLIKPNLGYQARIWRNAVPCVQSSQCFYMCAPKFTEDTMESSPDGGASRACAREPEDNAGAIREHKATSPAWRLRCHRWGPCTQSCLRWPARSRRTWCPLSCCLQCLPHAPSACWQLLSRLPRNRIGCTQHCCCSTSTQADSCCRCQPKTSLATEQHTMYLAWVIVTPAV